MKLNRKLTIQELETLKGGVVSMAFDLQSAIDYADNIDFVIQTLKTLVFELKDNIMSVETSIEHFEIRKELLED